MGFLEGLSDTGEITGRGNPLLRGTITGVGTFLGGYPPHAPVSHPQLQPGAHHRAMIVVAIELIVLAYLRWRFFEDSFIRALGLVTLGGVIIAAVSAGLGSALGGSSIQLGERLRPDAVRQAKPA